MIEPFAIGRHISLIKTSARETQICSAVNTFVWDPRQNSITGFLNNFLSYVKTHLSNCEKSGGASSKTIVHGSVLKIWRALARFLSKNVSNG